MAKKLEYDPRLDACRWVYNTLHKRKWFKSVGIGRLDKGKKEFIIVECKIRPTPKIQNLLRYVNRMPVIFAGPALKKA